MVPPLEESFVKGRDTEADNPGLKENGADGEIITPLGNSANIDNSKENTVSELDFNVKRSENDEMTDNGQNCWHTEKSSAPGNKSEISAEDDTASVSPLFKAHGPHVKQDFGAISVGPEYAGDDLQPLEEQSGSDTEQMILSDSEDEEGEDEEGVENDNDNVQEEDDIRAAYGKSATE